MLRTMGVKKVAHDFEEVARFVGLSDEQVA
jgi:hypothetical protein